MSNFVLKPMLPMTVEYEGLFDYRALILFLLIFLINSLLNKRHQTRKKSIYTINIFSFIWYCFWEIFIKMDYWNLRNYGTTYDKLIGADRTLFILISLLIICIMCGALTYLIMLLIYKVIRKLVSKREE